MYACCLEHKKKTELFYFKVCVGVGVRVRACVYVCVRGVVGWGL